MDIRDVISGKRPGAWPALLRCGLTCLVPLYATAVAARNWAYDRGWRRVERVEWPVISVGNLTTGGTGKTPMVAWLAKHIQQLGQRPVLLSRGYKSLNGAENDEKLLLDQLCSSVPHLQNRDRVSAARTAIDQRLGDVFILDDGYQHRRLHRDLDIVLIDAVEPWGHGHLLPRGLLREPVKSLRRAGFVIITRSELVGADELTRLREVVGSLTNAPFAISRFVPFGLVAVDGDRACLETLQSLPVAAFCGIGNPSAFEQTLTKACGSKLMGFRRYPDHHHYSSNDVESLSRWSAEIGAGCLVTTRKDLVKLNRNHFGNCRLWALDLDLAIDDREAVLLEAIQKSLAGTRTAG